MDPLAPTSRVPLVHDGQGEESLPIPNPSFTQDIRHSVNGSTFDSPAQSEPANSQLHLNTGASLDPSSIITPYHFQDKPFLPDPPVEDSPKRTNRYRFLVAAVVLIAIIAAVVLGVYFGVVRHHTSAAATGSGSQPQPTYPPPPSRPTDSPSSGSGYIFGDGTVVTTDQGTTFVYSNKFGGYFVDDRSNPFNNDARAQSWSPPLNTSWQWGTDQVLGVNLGGWLVLEPFITPALYQKYPSAIDEWTLSTAMAADTASGGLNQLEDHYNTFITEEDFAQIAGAGLNWVRLPIPFWAIDTWGDEPFLPKVCWKYALKAFDWSRKYGLRILLDIHSTPGSQNGYNHSGQSGIVNLLNGVMGIANAQRLLHYIRIFTEFVSQPQYLPVIPMLGIVNEPTGMPMEDMYHFYIEAHSMIRNITGVGAGNGPYISIQGGDPDLPTFLGSDRIALEQHPYYAFNGEGSEDVVPYISAPCSDWAPIMTSSQETFGVTTAAEWSLAFNDCGLMLLSAADEHTTLNCPPWDDWENYTATTKQNLMDFAMANMDALQQWFFWTWKVGSGAPANSPRAPLWSYQLGLQNGWIPLNPRDATGQCSRLGVRLNPTFDGVYEPYQTGGGDGSIDAADVARYGLWPPTSIGLVANALLLPTYTATGPVPTLPTETFPAPTPSTSIDYGTGWFDPADNAPGIVAVAGCPYPNPWDATAAVVPTTLCTGTPAMARRDPAPAPAPVVTHIH